MSTSRRTAVAVSALVIAITAALSLATFAGGEGSHGVAPSTLTTAPAPVTVAAPPVGPLPQAAMLDRAGALLTPSPTRAVLAQPVTAACTDLGTPGWTVRCGAVEMAGGRRVWLVENEADSWRVSVLGSSDTEAGWHVDLSSNGAPPGIAAINVKAEDLTGDGMPELVVGFRAAGLAGHLSYDIVTNERGTAPSVAASRHGLPSAQVAVGGGLLTEYVAAPCCPGTFDKNLVRWVGGGFSLLPSAPVPAPGPGPLDL